MTLVWLTSFFGHVGRCVDGCVRVLCVLVNAWACLAVFDVCVLETHKCVFHKKHDQKRRNAEHETVKVARRIYIYICMRPSCNLFIYVKIFLGEEGKEEEEYGAWGLRLQGNGMPKTSDARNRMQGRSERLRNRERTG